MNNFLAIDTSSRYLTVLAVKGEKIALRYLPDCAMKHSVILMDEIDGAMKEVLLRPDECDFFAAVTGPGSFTGIRIGIATAKGFALGANKPLLPITSFELLAYNVTDEKFYTVIDAMHDHYYVCGYDGGKREILAPCYLGRDGTEALDAPLYGFEDLKLSNYTRISPDILKAVKSNTGKLTHDMHALYVRKSQAEEARKC